MFIPRAHSPAAFRLATVIICLLAAFAPARTALGQTEVRVPAPAFTLAATGPGEVTVTISRVTRATQYHIYRSVDAVIDPVNGGIMQGLDPVGTVPAFSTATTTFVDRGLPTLVWQRYAVVAEVLGEFSASPLTREVVVTAAPGAPIWGVADIHTHQFSNLGFGGLIFHGSPFSPDGDMSTALPWCDFRGGITAVDRHGQVIPPNGDGKIPVHGPAGVNDLVGAALGQGFGHHVGGYPQYDGWPTWGTKNHQQMYYQWVERAYRGGLKLFVMHAVNNKVLCQSANQIQGFGCEDMPAADRQIQAAKDLEAFIDSRSGGPGRGWYRIAYTARQAREIINSGKMAVILGIEVDDLYNCSDGQCTPEVLGQRVQHYYDLGVRHVHPIHVFDNPFGGSAEYTDVFNYGNRIVNGQYFQTRDCSQPGSPDDVGYTFGGNDRLLGYLITALGFGNYVPPVYPGQGHCNANGLTPLGETLMNQLMDRGMIIDVDHMSQLSLNRALELAEARRYPAIAMGHTGFLENHVGEHKIEADKTASQLERLRKLGGIVGVISHKGATDHISTYPGPNDHPSFVTSRVPDDCDSSSKSFAQEYLFAVERMRGAGVGIGTDWNGLNGQPSPRFGPDACKSEPGAPNGDLTGGNQSEGVTYPFNIYGRPGVYSGKLDRSRIGQRLFDINADGLAHAGMLPDFIEDLRKVGVTDHDLAPLFNSAEAYIRMWERAEEDHVAPTTNAARSAEPNADGWYNTNVPVTVSLSAADNAGGVGVSHIDYSAAGATTVGETRAGGAAATTPAFSAEGTTTLTFAAFDNYGNWEYPRTLQLNFDRTAPTAAVHVPAAGGTYGLGQPVAAFFECADTISGVKTCEGDTALHGLVDTSSTGQKQYSVTVTDLAGNTFTKTVTYTVSPPTTTTAVNSDRPSAKYGEPVTFTAAVTPSAPGGAAPAGSVQFFDGTAPLGTAALADGVASLTVPGLAVGTHSVTAFYAQTSEYMGSTSPAFELVVGKATPTFDFAGGPFTYDGKPHAFNVTIRGVDGGTIGAVDATYDGSNQPPTKAGSYTARANYGGSANYEPATGQATLVIAKAPASINLGGLQHTYDGTPKGATAATSPAGLEGLSVTYDGAAKAPTDAGSYAVVASLVNDNYEAPEANGTLVIDRAAPAIIWADPADITYGTPLGGAQLSATADVPGTFNYTPAAGTVLHAGQGQTLSVTFVPADAANYQTASATARIDVAKANPSLGWADPADIVYGTPLGAAQLTAVANVPGTFTYSPAASTLLGAGSGQTLTVTFEPSDAANYNVASAQARINVLKATPVFSGLSFPTVVLGTAATALSGRLDSGGLVPTGSVSVTLNGVTQSAPIQPDGSFSTNFQTGGLQPSGSAYSVAYAYAGGANFNGAAGVGALSVAYQVKTLLDPTKSYRSGAVVPIKLQLFDANMANVSSPSVAVTAVGVVQVASNSSVELTAPGNSTPDLNFRYDPAVGAGGGYAFNLSTKGFPTGTYILRYTVGVDPTVHALQFQVRQ